MVLVNDGLGFLHSEAYGLARELDRLKSIALMHSLKNIGRKRFIFFSHVAFLWQDLLRLALELDRSRKDGVMPYSVLPHRKEVSPAAPAAGETPAYHGTQRNTVHVGTGTSALP